MGKIEWTDRTWNPTRGCSRVNDDCDHCYAMRQARRHDHPGGAYEGLTRLGKDGGVDWSGKVKIVASQLALPIHWSKPQKIFVDSMSDLFHPSVSVDTIAAVFGVMALACQHTYQIATKRPERMARIISSLTLDNCWVALDNFGIDVTPGQSKRIGNALPKGSPFAKDSTADLWPLPNVWLLVSAGTQELANEMLPWLMRTPAAVRGLSAEPLRGPIDIREWLPHSSGALQAIVHRQKTGHDCSGAGHEGYCEVCRVGFGIDAPSLDWVIAGGESGYDGRPMHPGWALALAHQCQARRVPFFFKQWGRWKPLGNMAPKLGDVWVFANGGFEAWTPTNHAPFSAESRHLKEGPHVIMRATGRKSDARRLDGQTFEAFPT